MVLRVRSNIREVRATLTRVQRRQIPFAASKALNDVAFADRKYIINKVFPRAFPTGRKQFARALYRVHKATKQRLVSRVDQVLDREYMELHERGGTRRAHDGGRMAVPIEVRRTSRGKVTKSNQIQNLRGSYTKQLAGGEGIFQKVRNREFLRYILKEQVRVRPVYPFTRLGLRFADRIWPRTFDKAVQRALRTARRR